MKVLSREPQWWKVRVLIGYSWRPNHEIDCDSSWIDIRIAQARTVWVEPWIDCGKPMGQPSPKALFLLRGWTLRGGGWPVIKYWWPRWERTSAGFRSDYNDASEMLGKPPVTHETLLKNGIFSISNRVSSINPVVAPFNLKKCIFFLYGDSPTNSTLTWRLAFVIANSWEFFSLTLPETNIARDKMISPIGN